MEYLGLSLWDYPEKDESDEEMENEIKYTGIRQLTNNNKENYPGIYFIGIINEDNFNIIYIGQSNSNIGNRLNYHYKNFKNEVHKWNKWLNEADISLNKIYFFCYKTNFSITMESTFIDFGYLSITYPLNIKDNRNECENEKLISYKQIKYPKIGYDYDSIVIIMYGLEKSIKEIIENLRNNTKDNS